ncbi:hypothetical protein DUNSADRAFT_12966 [Dunaliella salina]|uniref:Encoded protein n=1 Tax=Dunaliella salina TaxID=3046 RepID=A0ABQ7GAC5_DUNSA|nr:hypothetical protein DUNSADRAFT_12966 [Dunaliella salina]|eukprot:KAF5831553.1 hypothetical protein DUNSADRAFT_12966 [Dunaliella salina]
MVELKLCTSVVDQVAADEPPESGCSLARIPQQQGLKPPPPSSESSQRLLKLTSNIRDQTAVDEAIEGRPSLARTSRQQHQLPPHHGSMGVAEMLALVRPPQVSAQSKAVEAGKEAKRGSSHQGDTLFVANQPKDVEVKKEAQSASSHQDTAPPDAPEPPPTSPPSQPPAPRAFTRSVSTRSVSFAQNVVDTPRHRRASALDLRRKSACDQREQAHSFKRRSLNREGGKEDSNATICRGRVRRSSSLARSLEQLQRVWNIEQLLGDGGGPTGSTQQQEQQQQQRRFTDGRRVRRNSSLARSLEQLQGFWNMEQLLGDGGGPSGGTQQQQQQRRFTDGGTAASARRMSTGPPGGCKEGIMVPSGGTVKPRNSKVTCIAAAFDPRAFTLKPGHMDRAPMPACRPCKLTPSAAAAVAAVACMQAGGAAAPA